MRLLFLNIVVTLCVAFPVQAQVKRIISLAPHASELAFAAGLGDKLVAVSEYSDYPAQALKLEKVANYQGLNIERILTLKPDLVIAWPAGNPAKELDKLKQLGLRIYTTKTQKLDDIANNIEALSQFADDPSIGQQAARDFRQSLITLKQSYGSQSKVRYFYQLSEKPIITLAKGSWPSEVFEFCGGENIFANSASPYPQVGIEQVLLAKPDVIFTSEHAIKNGTMWQKWQQQLPAVQNGFVWALTSDWLNRPTPRTLQAIEEVCEYFSVVRQKR
ncbi:MULTISPECIES: vitamin B12 ABC transporter substrate-binding protein BtuF [unclassified Vibrio]|uniref:vitamin B12 ABC transporter substrate-binding protein BtuF n=1 Tax=unclassified Vibrio TaxID=2614977 RepID=UPI000B8ED5F1|nr:MULTISPECIES: vitamin B12 ABC transporter substrate-binding protein BtuF [unclassified Vibrio]NAW91631.1 vitamin B12 ABC transporter substrate-binding protein BtuF [Vibrio sp. V24_P1S3T111]OXX19363.1 vitamin B12 ABC transporter substrate-binding protein BtuF [Vibrio sp. V06_P1A73T115]OXX23570.1 vitamin B12 ABC transporter substrate-binding protein BtuF [Vibrio sp. V05_P4A8T149]OXX29600.1 vitamin B12 ABC transporter substrate-binding protein BtuF [Vibrio sp. V04_P4A5T148]OXX31894.1 vitamin B